MSLGSDRASFEMRLARQVKARQGQLKRRWGVWCIGCMGVCLGVSRRLWFPGKRRNAILSSDSTGPYSTGCRVEYS